MTHFASSPGFLLVIVLSIILGLALGGSCYSIGRHADYTDCGGGCGLTNC